MWVADLVVVNSTSDDVTDWILMHKLDRTPGWQQPCYGSLFSSSWHGVWHPAVPDVVPEVFIQAMPLTVSPSEPAFDIFQACRDRFKESLQRLISPPCFCMSLVGSEQKKCIGR